MLCALLIFASMPLFIVNVAAADYTNGVDVSGTTATIWFKSNVSTTWVDVHYTVNSGAQQNLRMTYNSGKTRYEQNVTGVASGNVISYSFTYNNGSPAYDTGWFSYTVGSTGGTTTVATPSFSPGGGTYTTAQNVTITTSTSGATIRYTTDGSTPTGSSTVYSGPVNISSSKTLKAIAIKSGMTNSAVASASFTISSGASSINSIAASSIPAPVGSGVMSVKVMNGTNGAYPDSQIYWGVLGINPANGKWSYLDLSGNLLPISNALNDASGHLTKNGQNYANIYHKISDAGWASMPKVTSGRMFICVGSPCYIKTYDTGFAGPDINNPSDPNLNVYFDFIEFTVDNDGYHGNTTRVDMFGFPLQHRLVSNGGFDQTVGEFESETRSGLFTKYSNEVPTAFKSLGTVQAPYRIVAPIHGSFAAGGANANYFAGYSSYSTQDILRCDGALTNAQTCAAINRHVLNDSNWNIVSNYYKAAPANYYAKFWHDHSIGGLAYGFAYDDVNTQAAYLEIGSPKGLILRVGW
ncbi:chitobiase/beta-hexosaminidase C-terminal domain-containing protein [Paenibacillus athensensis]|uniref:beta-1,3-glucanase family protein n=1 Tax=Paenibacillus athensensis TaxID=1967502 RepID=UPI001E4E5761|nr:beta-1,3-glucanase family protein [Paenibacillus athensensis]MCD1261153.1 chitobiase/beta-hexosaminidase C-terminal domain-containing protein [Paenibacillus athensensis]